MRAEVVTINGVEIVDVLTTKVINQVEVFSHKSCGQIGYVVSDLATGLAIGNPKGTESEAWEQALKKAGVLPIAVKYATRKVERKEILAVKGKYFDDEAEAKDRA